MFKIEFYNKIGSSIGSLIINSKYEFDNWIIKKTWPFKQAIKAKIHTEDNNLQNYNGITISR